MDMDTDRLIACLRIFGRELGKTPLNNKIGKYMLNAADTIETLIKERDHWQERYQQAVVSWQDRDKAYKEAQAEIERMRDSLDFARTKDALIFHLDAELESTKEKLASYKVFYDDVVNEPDCITCANKYCQFRPQPGEITRFNCPLWQDK